MSYQRVALLRRLQYDKMFVLKVLILLVLGISFCLHSDVAHDIIDDDLLFSFFLPGSSMLTSVFSYENDACDCSQPSLSEDSAITQLLEVLPICIILCNIPLSNLIESS